MRLLKLHPDYIGATLSSLCMMHCFLTPILFITQAHMSTAPGWWQPLNFVFLFLSFLAIYRSVQNSSNQLVKVMFFVFWTLLAFLLISEEFEILHLPEAITYAAGFSLAFLHIYNKKYCQCDKEECCAEDKN